MASASIGIEDEPVVQPGPVPVPPAEVAASLWKELAAQLVAQGLDLEPKLNRYIPHRPHPRQAIFLLLDVLEALFGGAAGGGKSDALLMAALQYVHLPNYNAVILRRTYADLALPGAIMDRAHDWLAGTDAKWIEKDKCWRFPSGASLTFGYCYRKADVARYKSTEFQFIGIDEVNEWPESWYTFLFSRLRRLKGSSIPLRMRCATNPGGTYGAWVKRRFIDEGSKDGRLFIPSLLDDNPSLDAEEYDAALRKLDPVTYEQLRHGNWTVRGGRQMIRREWFYFVDHEPVRMRWVRVWDLAATVPSKANPHPDWTCGGKIGSENETFCISDVCRFRARPLEVEQRVVKTALMDGPEVDIYMFVDPGQAGRAQFDRYQRLLGRYGIGIMPLALGNKSARKSRISSAAEARRILVVKGNYVTEMFDEFESCPNEEFDDQLDVVGGGLEILDGMRLQSEEF